jgi:hypothetical protein
MGKYGQCRCAQYGDGDGVGVDVVLESPHGLLRRHAAQRSEARVSAEPIVPSGNQDEDEYDSD